MLQVIYDKSKRMKYQIPMGGREIFPYLVTIFGTTVCDSFFSIHRLEREA